MLPKKPDRPSIDTFYSRAIKMIVMKDAVQRLNAEYRLNLTEEEIEPINKQGEAAKQLFQKLFTINF
jgi:hypothetical protein